MWIGHHQKFCFLFSISNLTCCKFVALKENTLTLFKIITVTRPSTFLRVLFIGDQDLQLKEGLGRALILLTKKLSPPIFLYASPHPSLDPSRITFR